MSSLCVDVPALETLRDVRLQFVRWLKGLSVDDATIDLLALAVHEALSNAIRHSGTPTPAVLVARHFNSLIAVEVKDHGRWSDPAEDHPGLGLKIMKNAVESTTINIDADGTTVRLLQHFE